MAEEKAVEKTLHDVIVEIRGSDTPIHDPKIAEDVLRKAVEILGLPRGIVALSIREGELVPAEARKEIFNSGVRTDLSPEDKIKAWVTAKVNLYKIHTIKEFSEMIGVTGGQLRTFIRTHGHLLVKREGRTYEVRPNEKR